MTVETGTDGENTVKNTTTVSVVYNMGHGKKVYRQYLNVDVNAVKDAMVKVIDDPEYQEKYTDFTTTDSSQIFACDITDFKYHAAGSEMKKLSDEQHRKLIDAYLNDFKNLRGETMSSEIPVGQIELALFTDKNDYPQAAADALKAIQATTAATSDRYSYYTQNYPIYPSFTETIGVIKELFGADFFDDEFAHISSIDIYYNDDAVVYDEYGNAQPSDDILYQRYMQSGHTDLTYEEFIKEYGTQQNPSVTDPTAIRNLMDSTRDVSAIDFTSPFFMTDNSVTYTVNYDNGNTTDRVKLIK